MYNVQVSLNCVTTDSDRSCSLYWGCSNKRFFLKSDAANGFSGCITQKNDFDQFSQKNFDFLGVRNSILVYDVINPYLTAICYDCQIATKLQEKA